MVSLHSRLYKKHLNIVANTDIQVFLNNYKREKRDNKKIGNIELPNNEILKYFNYISICIFRVS